ncbi:PREDICTED: uncharacterized protein LOC108569182, partial [Nicrophorus vespilloides]|uniref:Uncharacterized protein LOC108569182 n=1 Tax=Nicrophorus vespilloides TaxID=110193 RepID=A0ABM1NH35_NICVS
MATAARFAASGGGSSPPTPAPATTPPVQAQATQLIVLPASLHQGTIVNANGVPVIDVSALEQAADSSNESTATGENQVDVHESDPLALEEDSPHFITVTEATARSYASLTPVQPTVVASEGDTVASHQGYHVQYVEPEIYASQTNGGQAQMAYPVYTVGETGTLYASQGQYYAANTGNSTNSAAVGYTTTTGHYLVQQTVDGDGLIAPTRHSPQTTSA